jgi:hypothetical protein
MEENTTVYNKLEVTNPFVQTKKDKIKKKHWLYTQVGGFLLMFMNIIEVLFITLNFMNKDHISSCLLDTCRWNGNGYNCFMNRSLFEQ